MNEALRPTNNFFSDFSSLGKSEEQKELPALKEEEEQLAHLARTDGWDLFTKIVNEYIDEMDGMVRSAMDAGAGFEEIGRKTAVKEITKDVLKKLVSRVEEAREASDRRTTK